VVSVRKRRQLFLHGNRREPASDQHEGILQERSTYLSLGGRLGPVKPRTVYYLDAKGLLLRSKACKQLPAQQGPCKTAGSSYLQANQYFS